MGEETDFEERRGGCENAEGEEERGLVDKKKGNGDTRRRQQGLGLERQRKER